MTFLAPLLGGPAAYPRYAEAVVGLRPLAGLGTAMAIFAGAVVCGAIVQSIYLAGRPPAVTSGAGDMTAVLAWLIGMQAGMVGLTLAAARFSGAPVSLRLFLRPPPQGAGVYWTALLLLIALVAVYNAISYGIGASDLVTDLKTFEDMVRSPAWLAAMIAIGVGAPVSEELLFRGYLQPALAASAIGFRGAAVATTALWTVLHAGYTVSGLVEVAVVGLYMSWVLYRTGSVWVTIFCHAAYNSLLMVGLMLWTQGG